MYQRRVAIIEDDLFVAGLLEQSLQANGFQTAQAHNALEAKALLADFEPDVALVDIELGDGPSGVDLMSLIVRAYPGTAVLMMTQRSAFSKGLDLPDGVAFLLKSKISDPVDLVSAIESTIRGQGHLTRHAISGDLEDLTRVQEEVLRMIALGYSNAKIAAVRGVTLSGAEQSVSSVLRALSISEDDGVVPRVEATRRYIAARGLPSES